MPQADYYAVKELLLRSLANNATRVGIMTSEWDVAGRCMRPVTVELTGRRTGRRGLTDPYKSVGKDAWGTEWGVLTNPRIWQSREVMPSEGPTSVGVIMHVPCRRCESCRKRRAWMWMQRARAELAFSARTWFGTLTLKPGEQHKMLSQARHRYERQGGDFDLLPAEDQFRLVVSETGPDITKWMKRVRETSSARLRFLLVSEAHESGLPHFHILLHEVWATERVTKRVLEDQWKLGFSHWRVATPENPRVALYLTKYIAKSAAARVRASARYGQGALSIAGDEKSPSVEKTTSSSVTA